MRFILIFMTVILLAGKYKDKDQVAGDWIIGEPELSIAVMPLFPEKEQNDMVTLQFSACGTEESLDVTSLGINFTDGSDLSSLASVSVWYSGTDPDNRLHELFATTVNPGKSILLHGNTGLRTGSNRFIISFAAGRDADLASTIGISSVSVTFSDGTAMTCVRKASDPLIRFGRIVRAAGQDRVNTYRIPGIVTTSAGTLIAVYDIRYNNSKDLQEDINIGMSRSTDGGQTWEPMRVIMDMGEYGGRPEQLNGIGDPCVLYDDKTGTIWVAALWLSGSSPDKMVWWVSQPGMTPEETGQFMLVKSTDDGLTWSEPVSITPQIKDPAWQLLFQGPGRGITLNDGTLVFPAQFKADIGVKALDGGQYTCQSTIVWSRDGGNTWHIGTGAKTNTTEAQVAELADGSLMLNMRDDRNRTEKGNTNGRAVSVTHDMGKTWEVHPSSNSALPEPNCMASLISAYIKVGNSVRHVLFFSNPADKSTRTHMTVKASFDEGLTWPPENQLELYSPVCYGYSCLTMVDESELGIFYEGSGDLCFQKINVSKLTAVRK
jgi:sialidase-1